jgi:hypothetical protein
MLIRTWIGSVCKGSLFPDSHPHQDSMTLWIVFSVGNPDPESVYFGRNLSKSMCESDKGLVILQTGSKTVKTARIL